MNFRSGFRLGVSNDPNAAPPTVKDVLDAVLSRAQGLMQEVLAELHVGDAGRKVHRLVEIQHPGAKEAAQQLADNRDEVAALFQRRLSDGLMHGSTVQAVPLRFDDLGLFGDEELSESVELARAQDEVSLAVEDAMPQLDAVMATMLGWRTPQPAINPLRPEVFVRALRETLFDMVPESSVREALIVPAAGHMGARLHRMYRELGDWLRSFGIEPAMRAGQYALVRSGTSTAAAPGSVAQSLLTLDKLRHLLVGNLDSAPQPADKTGGEFGLTVPASFEVLQQLKQVDAVVQKIERRRRTDPSKAAARRSPSEGEPEAPASLGRQLGEEVIRLMFDNLVQDRRLLPAVATRLKQMEPQLQTLAQVDSRFFSDRQHPARQLLDHIAQRSLGYQAETDPGFDQFLASVDELLAQLSEAGSSAQRFADLLAQLDARWVSEDEVARHHRAEAAQALLHVEQRGLLARRIADELEGRLKVREVQKLVTDFLSGPWALVLAEARLKSSDGSSDLGGYEALIEDLLWSVESERSRKNPRRLAAIVPALLQKLREGLATVDYPQAATVPFFEDLARMHGKALEQRQGSKPSPVDEDLLPASSIAVGEMDEVAQAEVWVGSREAGESGFISRQPSPADVAAPTGEDPEAESAPTRLVSALRIGSWIELRIKQKWLRAQLTWASPHGTLFMFTSASGSAHSMSKRTMDRLLDEGGIRVVAEDHLLDQAFDRVAGEALKNSVKGR